MAGTGERTDRPLIAVAILASFVAFLDGSVVNLALPAISREFGGGLALQQWVIDGYLLSLGALILVAGAISDAFGRLVVLRWGLVIFAVSSLLCAAAPSGWVLVAARCLQGVGAAFLVPSSLAMINARFSGPRQAAAIGTWTAWTGTAFVIGPLLGGVLVDALNWRWIFGVNVVPLIVTLYLTTKLADEEFGSDRHARVDVVGAVLTAVGLTGAVYALIEQQRMGLSHPAVLISLIVGVACLVAFPWWERRAPSPMMPPQIFSARNFAVGNLATVFLYAAVSLGMLLVALFLQETAGLSATAAGLATLPIPVFSFFFARWFGSLAGRHGPRLYMALGPLVAAAGYLLMTRVSEPVELLDSAAARPDGVRARAVDDGVAVDRGDSGGRGTGTERDRLRDQQRDLPHRRTGRGRPHRCDRRRANGFRRVSLQAWCVAARPPRGGRADLVGGHPQRGRRLQPGVCGGCGGMP